VKKLQNVIRALFFIACASCIHAEIFETIDVLKAYAKSMPESVPLKNLDYLNPDYSNFLKAHTPTAWDDMLMTIGLKRRSAWQPQPFLDLLHRVTEKRTKDGLHGRFLQRHEVSQDDHFLIWGNIQGAYHSLVYTLEHLIEQRIIDKDLKVIAPKYFIVFAGNVIDRSPYGLETLTIVLRLLDANPTRVFYVRGNHESNNLWQAYDFRDQVEYKIANIEGKFPPYKEGLVPHTQEINAFFETLPLALYLGMKTIDSADAIRIGYAPGDEFSLTDGEMIYLLNAINTTILPLPITVPQEQDDTKSGTIVAMTEGSDDLIPDYTSKGLRLLPPDQGTTAWSILSAQTDCYNKLYKFITDSYVDVTIALPMQRTTITQHYQDVPARTGFKTGRVYNMLSGQADEQFRSHAKMEIIEVGTTLDLTGESAILGEQIRDGLSLAINNQNQLGIIPGHIINLTMLNDNHTLSNARWNIESLLGAMKMSIIMGVEENIMYRSYLDLVTKKDILVLFPFTGVAALRAPNYTNIIHYGPSYKDEAFISTQYILDVIAPSKVAILYEKKEMGEDALIGARDAFKEKGFTAYIEVPFMSNQLDFTEQIMTIRRENPAVIGIFALPAVAQEFIRQIGIQNLSQRTLYGLSAFGAQSFRHFYKSKGLEIIVTHLVPSPYNSDFPIAQEFRQHAAENNVAISPQSFEAYINGTIFVEALRIIKGPITTQSIKRSLESMKDYAFKGLQLTFNKDKRELSNAIWIEIGHRDEWEQFAVQYNGRSIDKTSNDMVLAPAAELPKQKKLAPAAKIAKPVEQNVAIGESMERRETEPHETIETIGFEQAGQ